MIGTSKPSQASAKGRLSNRNIRKEPPQGQTSGYDDWAVLPGQGLYYNPDMIFPDGRRRIDGYCTDVVTDLAVDWLENKRQKDKPFMLMVQHKAPHRNWMPALRHLDLYDDVEIPEPPTLFDEWKDNAPPHGCRNLKSTVTWI